MSAMLPKIAWINSAAIGTPLKLKASPNPLCFDLFCLFAPDISRWRPNMAELANLMENFGSSCETCRKANVTVTLESHWSKGYFGD